MKSAKRRNDDRRAYRLTDAQRRELAEACRRIQPWKRSRGPRTHAGKRVSRANARRTGCHDAPNRVTRARLGVVQRFLRMFGSFELLASGKAMKWPWPVKAKLSRMRVMPPHGTLRQLMVRLRQLRHTPPTNLNMDTATEWLVEHRALAREPLRVGELEGVDFDLEPYADTDLAELAMLVRRRRA